MVLLLQRGAFGAIPDALRHDEERRRVLSSMNIGKEGTLLFFAPRTTVPFSFHIFFPRTPDAIV